ncbi:hypothetical protein [Bacillus sp. AG4(2022)]|uniref:hypothetical protein n=1 Tax=Bacillus sp. AG4(2022) TaxID=2962594 RepID=UPI002880FBA8|nr:hypothetical protein [Bacillus sp. AG4(2022)]MDT0160425.1 hypothetical protein [Bacillus sp. AG4(2022)]
MELKVGQTWVSGSHPHNDFKIYDIIVQEWDHHPTETLYCWKRVNLDSFNEFVAAKKGMSAEEFRNTNKNTYPYAWCGESKKGSLLKKIREGSMRLL